MIVSGREILKVVAFVALVLLALSYVVANRELLLNNLWGGRAAGPEAESVAAGGGGESPVGPLDLSSAELLAVAAPVGDQAARPEDTPGALAAASPGGSPPDGDALFVELRLERERGRSQELELLREVLSNPALASDERSRVLDLWLDIAEETAREADIENLIRAKGFADAVAVLRNGRATIVVKAARLTGEEVLRVADIAVRVAGIDYEDVTVMVAGG